MLLIAAFAFSACATFAQDLTSKKGEAYLPATGDWSIGIEATPLLDYLGNFISGNLLDSAPSWNNINGNQTIIGKMYKSESKAYRAIVRIGMSSNKSIGKVDNDLITTPPAFPATSVKKDDVMKSISHFIGLGAGVEKRRGTQIQQAQTGEQTLTLLILQLMGDGVVVKQKINLGLHLVSLFVPLLEQNILFCLKSQ